MKSSSLTLFFTLALSGMAHAQTVPDADQPRTQQQLFAQRCPGRVQTLLAAAIPASKPTDDTIRSICTCAQSKLDAVGDLKTDESAPKDVSLAALNCAKPAITAYNQGFASREFGPYLLKQGWKDEQVSKFSACFAETHWQQNFEQNLQNRRAKGSTLADLWKQCTAEAGHADTPMPKPPVASAPAIAASKF